MSYVHYVNSKQVQSKYRRGVGTVMRVRCEHDASVKYVQVQSWCRRAAGAGVKQVQQ